jgi:hypothetical protein
MDFPLRRLSQLSGLILSSLSKETGNVSCASSIVQTADLQYELIQQLPKQLPKQPKTSPTVAHGPSWVKPASHLALAALAACPLEGSQLPQLPPPLLLHLSTTGNVNKSRELDTSHYNFDKISSRSSETLKHP